MWIMYYLISDFICCIERAVDSMSQGTAILNIHTVLAIDVYDMHITT